MKQLIRKNITGLLMLALSISLFGMTIPSLAQDLGAPLEILAAEGQTPPIVTTTEPPRKSDVAITNLWAINSMPAPNGLVDFTAFYGNLGTEEGAVNVELKIVYDSKNLYNISLGDPTACTDDKTAVICRYNTLNPGTSNTVGFTANVVPTALPDTQIYYTASITSDTEENDKKNDFASLAVTVTSLEKGGRMTGVGGPADLEGGTLGQASTKGNVWLFDVKNDPNWKTDSLSTAGLKFLIRGKEALAWTLNITDSGFRNPAIQSNYLKVLTVVNGLFILGLLAIAAMWMFSLFIPRRTLRQVIVLYAIAVIFVNFALPINQLLIDGSNLLQRTFIGATNISDLVDTPTYNNPNSVGYQSQTGNLAKATTDKVTLSLGTAEQQANKDVAVGKLQQGFQTPVMTGTVTSADGKSVQAVGLNSTGNDPTLYLNTNQKLEFSSEKTFNPNEENRIFAFALLLLTGIAYFGMALTFILRIVILWALMIVSPILFLLAIFHSTRGYFYNWLSLYARWLLIGPLMALGIAMVVGIWKVSGMPIVSSYPGVGMFGQLTNVGFYLPGTELANNLSTTPQMMQYVLFLTMLYLPLIFAFMLTRQRLIGAAATVVTERNGTERNRAGTNRDIATKGTETKTSTVAERVKPLAGGLKGLFDSGLGRSAKPAMPTNLRSTESRGPTLMAGTAALPEQLALTNVRDMLGLASGGEGSRNSHEKGIERLAAASAMADTPERQTLMAVRNEIEERASKNDPEATRVLSEIHEREGTTVVTPNGSPVGVPIGDPQANVTVQADIQTKTTKGEAKSEKPLTTENPEKARAKALEGEEETDEEKRETMKNKREKNIKDE